MSKRNGPSRIKTIEQVREATQADLKRLASASPKTASIRKIESIQMPPTLSPARINLLRNSRATLRGQRRALGGDYSIRKMGLIHIGGAFSNAHLAYEDAAPVV